MHWMKILALLVPVAAASSEPIQSYDSYKSWLVACDNGLTCVAKGFSEDEKRAQISIERAAGPAGTITATISAANKFTLADVRLDGKSVELNPQDWKLDGGDSEFSLSSDRLPAIQAFVARLRNGSKLTLADGPQVPLDGFAAAMLRVDERQGRLDNVTALAKSGTTAAAQVPSAPALPRIPNHPITAKLASDEAQKLITDVRAAQKAVFEKQDCEADVSVMKPEAYALDDKLALVLLPCIMGAYQGSSLAFLAPRDGGLATQVIAPLAYAGNKPDRSGVTMFTESDFDPDTGTLAMAARGRGMADCGMSASWIWDGQAFRMASLSYQAACGGLAPGDWPTLFRSIQ
ncbi:DUF1176 domain-containing protein [Methylocella sp. CPCC 101449]|uniref:DUF1176 domain-containing protein n=1 Tax=Methylocella sp. CPCC 101449 TaxID=2987531 RepID=UPI00288D4E3C|nr:DUF1176 domain-containing protein [Methylocella sp. CPCC 101449]MDT2019988.1 DUF1176 domain-containing protein [Methylocella sp. CPCC 101449]